MIIANQERNGFVEFGTGCKILQEEDWIIFISQNGEKEFLGVYPTIQSDRIPDWRIKMGGAANEVIEDMWHAIERGATLYCMPLGWPLTMYGDEWNWEGDE